MTSFVLRVKIYFLSYVIQFVRELKLQENLLVFDEARVTHCMYMTVVVFISAFTVSGCWWWFDSGYTDPVNPAVKYRYLVALEI